MTARAEPAVRSVDDDEVDAWLRLLLADGVGRSTARRLLAAFGSAAGVRDASPAARRSVAGDGAAALAPPEDFDLQREATLRWLGGGPDRALWTLGDRGYPALLLQAPDPPLALFAHGDAGVLQRPALAVVGSRNATAQGLDNARAFARTMAEAGWCIVSGLAAGIDAAAHEGALAAAGGTTVAVLGTGPDRIYPSRHLALARQVAGRGLLLSEYVPGTPPLRHNFPPRNRLIAGLARGTLIVEAALQSGSLVTARFASEAGREVFAIPGSIHSPQSRGCHALIRQGAKLVETAADILEELAPGAVHAGPAAAVAAAGVPRPSDDDALLDALGHDPATLDALSARTGWSAAALNVRLLELELEGRVARLPGGLVQRRARG